MPRVDGPVSAVTGVDPVSFKNFTDGN